MFNVKEVGLIIDLDHYPLLDEKSYKNLVSNFYIPFIRLLKSHKESSFSLKISLHTLDLLDRSGFESVISEIKDLYQNERVEIVGSVPFKSHLICQPKEIIESQITLNECGVGYYLGARQGFEGEPSVMLKDLNGFFSGSVSINEDLIGIIENLGYKWILSDEISGNSMEMVDDNFNVIRSYDFTPDVGSFVYEKGESINSSRENDFFNTKLNEMLGKIKESNASVLLIDLGKCFLIYNNHDKLLRFVDYIFREMKKRTINIVSVSSVEKKLPKTAKYNLPIASFGNVYDVNTLINNIKYLHSILSNINNIHLNDVLLNNKKDYAPNKEWCYEKNNGIIEIGSIPLSYIEYKLYEIISLYEYCVISKHTLDSDLKETLKINLVKTVEEIHPYINVINNDDMSITTIKENFTKFKDSVGRSFD